MSLSPLILQAQISPPAGGGSFGLADTTLLENPFQAPMWLDEIRFRVPNTTSVGAAWSSLRVELKLGEIPITNGFVPISTLGKVLDESDGSPGGEFYMNSFTWKLPKPLFIPARELLRPTIYFVPFSGAPARTVNIIYACRPLPKGTPTPRVLQLPWVTYFQPAMLTTPNATDQVDLSTPSDIFNPFDQDLHVQRFLGRFMIQDATQGIDGGNAGDLSSALINTDTGAIVTGTFVSAQDSFNNILIRDPTPFASVFDRIDRAWTVNCMLPPKGFYLFTIDRIWSAYTPALTATVAISMIGWREVQYVQGALR